MTYDNNVPSYDKRFYGIYEGICTNTNDPLLINRIKLQVPQILGRAETDWAVPCLPVTDNTTHAAHTDTVVSAGTVVSTFGSHTHSVTLNSAHTSHTSVPNLGQKVWIMFIAGDPNYPVWMGVQL